MGRLLDLVHRPLRGRRPRSAGVRVALPPPAEASGRRPARDRRRRASPRRHRPLLKGKGPAQGGTAESFGDVRFAHSFDEQQDDVAFRLGDVLVRVGQLAEHPPGQDLVERPVDDDRTEARIDLRPELARLLAPFDDPFERLHPLRDLLDLLLNVRAPCHLADEDADEVRIAAPGAQQERGDLSHLFARVHTRALDFADSREHLRPGVPKDRLEELFLRLEVVVDEAVRDTGLLGDVPDARPVEAARGEDLDRRVENLPATVGPQISTRRHDRATLEAFSAQGYGNVNPWRGLARDAPAGRGPPGAHQPVRPWSSRSPRRAREGPHGGTRRTASHRAGRPVGSDRRRRTRGVASASARPRSYWADATIKPPGAFV